MNVNPIEKITITTKMSMERIAEILGVSRQTVNNYKKNPDSIPTAHLLKLSSASGISLDLLCGEIETIAGPNIKMTYEKKAKTLKNVLAAAETACDNISKIRIDDKLELCNKERAAAMEKLEDLRNIAQIKGAKPSVCAFGPSDSGKSTLINYLTSSNLVPAGYSPMTTVPTYLMHSSEKPDYLEDPADNAVVFGRRKGENKERFTHDMLLNGKAEEYIIRKGNYESILKDFGTREGAYYNNETYEIDEIDVFADVDLLREITFIDIPGFGTGDNENDDIGLTMDAGSFDIIFFLSPADGFLRGNELSAINQLLRMREDISSFYLLATHTNAIGNPTEVEKVIHEGCGRIARTMSENEKERLGIHESKSGFKSLEKRCMGFEKNSEFYCRNLNERIEKELPKIINARIQGAIREIRAVCKEYKTKYDELLDNTDKERRSVKSEEEIRQKEASTKEASKKASEYLHQAKERLNESINAKRAACAESVRKHYSAIMTESFITNAIDSKGFKNRKADIEDLSAYISNELNDRIQKDLKNKSEEFSNELENELEDYKQRLKNDIKSMDVDINLNGFDFTRAFATGLGGVAAYGALAVWATIVAGGSNLGAYILIAKVVSALSAIGISLGGTAAVTSAVAAIGGPVTIGIALAVLAAVAIFGIFTGTWKKRVAKKLINAYHEENVLGKYSQSIKSYWNDTKTALDECIKSLDNQIKGYYANQIEADKLSADNLIKTNAILQIVYNTCSDAYQQMYDAAQCDDDEN